jgi:hypothetical protein
MPLLPLLCRNARPSDSQLFSESRTLRHYERENRVTELIVRIPDPVACHHLSYINLMLNNAEPARGRSLRLYSRVSEASGVLQGIESSMLVFLNFLKQYINTKSYINSIKRARRIEGISAYSFQLPDQLNHQEP